FPNLLTNGHISRYSFSTTCRNLLKRVEAWCFHIYKFIYSCRNSEVHFIVPRHSACLLREVISEFHVVAFCFWAILSLCVLTSSIEVRFPVRQWKPFSLRELHVWRFRLFWQTQDSYPAPSIPDRHFGETPMQPRASSDE